jgi:hypothetical protein
LKNISQSNTSNEIVIIIKFFAKKRHKSSINILYTGTISPAKDIYSGEDKAYKLYSDTTDSFILATKMQLISDTNDL